MPLTRYIAEFADPPATLTRSSDRTYSHAWRARFERVADGSACAVTGFSRTADLAAAAAKGEASSLTQNGRLRHVGTDIVAVTTGGRS